MSSFDEPSPGGISVLSDSYFSDAQVAAFEQVFDTDPNLWFIRAMTKDGKDLLIFSGSHPDYSPAFVAKVDAATAEAAAVVRAAKAGR